MAGGSTLDEFMEVTQTLGSSKKALGNTLRGINHRQTGVITSKNKDRQGFTFLTRPQLNLSTNNVRAYRHLYSLLNKEKVSVQRHVRTLLDPRLMSNYGDTTSTEDGKSHTVTLDCPLTDKLNPFIPVLTNNIKSVSGWPDVVNSSFISKEGVRKEQYAMVDGNVDKLEAGDIDITFDNIREEPITMIFDTWLHYMSAVFEGEMSPYMDFIAENEIDYNTRIYRLVLSENRVVKKIAATGASYPLNVPMGKFFDYNRETPYSEQTKEISVRFKYIGVMYNDDILVQEFNETVNIFNPEMRKLDKAGGSPESTTTLRLLSDEEAKIRNHSGYPRINLDTYKLEWWIPA